MKLKGRFVMDLGHQHLTVLNETIQTLFFLSLLRKLLLQVEENANFDYDFKQLIQFFFKYRLFMQALGRSNSAFDWVLWGQRGFPRGSPVKNLPEVQEPQKAQFDPWVLKIPWRAWQPTPVFLPGEFHEQRSLVGYHPYRQSMESKSQT